MKTCGEGNSRERGNSEKNECNHRSMHEKVRHVAGPVCFIIWYHFVQSDKPGSV